MRSRLGRSIAGGRKEREQHVQVGEGFFFWYSIPSSRFARSDLSFHTRPLTGKSTMVLPRLRAADEDVVYGNVNWEVYS